MADESFKYEDEELDEIEYYEIVSYEEIIKLNPTFVAFSNEEIYNELFNFFKSKTTSEGFLKLFNKIIEKQLNPTNVNNFVVVADAYRSQGENFDIDEFIIKIKNSNKEQINIALKNKNKLWFPLMYDDDSTKIKFKASQTTMVVLGDEKSNNRYIVFKDDERNIPVMGVYFYEPSVIVDTYLNEKVMSHHYKQHKDVMVSADNYKSFDELIDKYKIGLPLNKIDEDEYYYTNINILLRKYNYDFDSISIEDFNSIKAHLDILLKKEKVEKIVYSSIKNKPVNLTNNRFLFFNMLKEENKLIENTNTAIKKIQKEFDAIKDEKIHVEQIAITKNLDELILNLSSENYDAIIKNLREIRKNISIDNCIESLQNYIKLDRKQIKKELKKYELQFELLKLTYRDLYKINFTFEKDEHDIKKGNDIKDYEGIPVRVNDFKKNTAYIDEGDEEDNDESDNIIQNDELNKYYNNYYYNLEKGFSQSLKIVLPFTLKMQEISKLPLNFDVITTHIFNLYRDVPEKSVIIKNKYSGDNEDSYYKELAEKTIKYVLTSDDEDKRLKDANIEYSKTLINIIYDIICKWCIEIQKELLEETLLFSKDRCYIPCIDKWGHDNYGSPFNLDAKYGVFYYLVCIFEDVFKEIFSENDYNYLPLEKDYKNKILDKLKTNYEDELNFFEKFGTKKKKDSKGAEAQKALVGILKAKDYKNDKFFENFIDSLIYMPSVKYEKIHKYLLGCCLEKIDDNFSADNYLKSNRKDLEKAKLKFSSDRVFNKKRYKRFSFAKKIKKEKREDFKSINNYKSYPIYESSIDEWFDNLSDNLVLSKKNIEDVRTKLRDVYNIHADYYLEKFFSEKSSVIKNYNKELSKTEYYKFSNYKQILLTISKILYTHLKSEALPFIKLINNTILELDNLSSIINEVNEDEIILIRSIFVIRCMCIPAFPDISITAKLTSKITIENDLHKTILKNIKSTIFKIIKDNNMPTLQEQINYINKVREENKDKILSSLNKKTREEKDILKEMKKIGFNVDEDPDDNTKYNNDNGDNFEREGEAENRVHGEDYDNDDNLDTEEYGFITS